MLFKVPQTYKGSFVLNTLKCTLKAGQIISISESKVSYPDVQAAIKAQVLVPSEEDIYDEEKYQKSSEAMIVNNTDKVLVLGKNIILKPWASLLIEKEELKNGSIAAAQKEGYIVIASDDNSYKNSYKAEKKENIIKAEKEEKPEEKPEEKKDFIIGEDRKVVPKVWDFRNQQIKEATEVPKTIEIKMIDEEKEEEDKKVDFVDSVEEPVEKPKNGQKNKNQRKTAKKKTTKKEDNKSEKQKTTKDDIIAIEMDSNGRAIKTAADALQHLIDNINKDEEISFVDKEQEEDRIKQKKLRDNSNNE